MTVSTPRATFTAWIASLSHLDSASEGFGGAIDDAGAVPAFTAAARAASSQAFQSRSAYTGTLIDIDMIRTLLLFNVSIILTKNPPIAIRKRSVDVRIFVDMRRMYICMDIL